MFGNATNPPCIGKGSLGKARRVRGLVLSLNLVFALVALPLLAIYDAKAQTPSATIVGLVVDPSAGAVPDATISVKHVGTNFRREVRTSPDGAFTVSNLLPGAYELTVEKEGFRRLIESNVTLQAAQIARIDLQLAVGALSESIEVTAAAVPLVNSEDGSKGEVIDTNEILEMPLQGRDYLDLAYQVPGVMPRVEGALSSGLNVNGARAENTNYVLDGFSFRSNREGAVMLNPVLDSVQEFKLQTANYSAEHGRLAGGVVNMVLKSGTNDFHGSLFEFFRNDKLDARNFFDAGKSKLRLNQFGATVGGPIQRDKHFFFFSWESARIINGGTQLTNVLTAPERSGDFSQSFDRNGMVTLIKDPQLSGSCTTASQNACFPQNVIPTSRLSSVGQNLLDFFPLPNLPGQPNNFRASGNTTNTFDNFQIRTDHLLSDRDTVSFRLLRRLQDSTNPFTSNSLGTFGADTDETNFLAGLTYLRHISPSVINEVRLGLTRQTVKLISVLEGQDLNAQVGIPGTTDDPELVGLANINITNLTILGGSVSLPINRWLTKIEIADTLSIVKGKHTLKVGGSLLRNHFFANFNVRSRGHLFVRGRWTNSGPADFMLGLLDSSQRLLQPSRNYLFATQSGLFVHDDYRITNNLTLNLGLRWELKQPMYDKHDRLSTFVPEMGKIVLAGDQAVPNLDALIADAGLGGRVALGPELGLPRSLVAARYYDLAPRFGFAWRPFGGTDTVLRGGYGVFHADNMLNTIRGDLANSGFPFALSESYTRFPNDPGLLALERPFPEEIRQLVGASDSTGIALDTPAQYLQNWNLTFERTLGALGAVELGYVGSKGTNLMRKFNINQPITGESSLPDGTFPQPFPEFSSIQFYSYGANSYYHGAIATLRRRFNNGLLYRLNYGFGKSLDEASQISARSAGGFQGVLDARNASLEKGRSDWDRRHTFTGNLSYLIDAKRNKFIRGWQISGLVRAYSGSPFTPQVNSVAEILGDSSRPDRIRNGSLDNPTREEWFDVDAFPQVSSGPFRFGNSGRNILDGPGFFTLDASLSRRFQVGESRYIQLRLEAFNLSNSTNFNLPEERVDLNAAGTISGAETARTMQLGLKFVF